MKRKIMKRQQRSGINQSASAWRRNGEKPAKMAANGEK
jgi:hypothetical protein